ncbi:hypothetical protein PG997_000676 [Apiospora hydei]|uniref:Uncharacterized protein n=1 Tax=Apiospora hydei TaxID=1337664 RepID=A0ABR1XBH3_9PEZI
MARRTAPSDMLQMRRGRTVDRAAVAHEGLARGDEPSNFGAARSLAFVSGMMPAIVVFARSSMAARATIQFVGFVYLAMHCSGMSLEVVGLLEGSPAETDLAWVQLTRVPTAPTGNRWRGWTGRAFFSDQVWGVWGPVRGAWGQGPPILRVVNAQWVHCWLQGLSRRPLRPGIALQTCISSISYWERGIRLE